MKLGSGIGLLSLLVVIGIIVYLFAGPTGSDGSSYGETLAEANREAKEQVRQIAGRDADGRPANAGLTLGDADRGVVVESIEPDQVIASHYGLREGDVMTQIGPNDVGGMIISGHEAAGDFLLAAYQANQSIEVIRDGETLALPAGEADNTQDGPPTAGQLPPQLQNLPTGR